MRCLSRWVGVSDLELTGQSYPAHAENPSDVHGLEFSPVMYAECDAHISFELVDSHTPCVVLRVDNVCGLPGSGPPWMYAILLRFTRSVGYCRRATLRCGGQCLDRPTLEIATNVCQMVDQGGRGDLLPGFICLSPQHVARCTVSHTYLSHHQRDDFLGQAGAWHGSRPSHAGQVNCPETAIIWPCQWTGCNAYISSKLDHCRVPGGFRRSGDGTGLLWQRRGIMRSNLL